MNVGQLLLQSDGVSRTVALLLLLMSVSSWVVLLWKSWLLLRAWGDVQRSIAAFWQAPDLAEAEPRLAGFDRCGLVLPLLDATRQPESGTLAAAGGRGQQHAIAG